MSNEVVLEPLDIKVANVELKVEKQKLLERLHEINLQLFGLPTGEFQVTEVVDFMLALDYKYSPEEHTFIGTDESAKNISWRTAIRLYNTQTNEWVYNKDVIFPYWNPNLKFESLSVRLAHATKLLKIVRIQWDRKAKAMIVASNWLKFSYPEYEKYLPKAA